MKEYAYRLDQRHSRHIPPIACAVLEQQAVFTLHRAKNACLKRHAKAQYS